MKHFLSLFSLGVSLSAGELPIASPNTYMPPFTVGHLQLEAEKQVSGVPHSYAPLDEFLKEAYTQIPHKKEYTKKDIYSILYSLHNLVTQRSPRCKEQEFLSQGLHTGVMDCDIRSVLYLAAADAFNLPMVGAMNIPEYNHMWIRWKLPDGSYINWETTLGREVKDAEFATYLPSNWGSPKARQQTKRPFLIREYTCEEYAQWVLKNTSYDRKRLPPSVQEKAHAEIERFFEIYLSSRALRLFSSSK